MEEEKKYVASPAAVQEVSKHDGHDIHENSKQADSAAALVAGFEGELDPVEAQRVLRKIDWRLLPMMMTLYFVQFMDKTTLGNSANLGIKTDTHLSTTQYNLLGTAFYLAYLVFEYPQNLALQRFPVGKWMSANITLWAVFLLCHAACTNFAGLFVVRLGLGVCEGSITAGFMIATQMWYTHTEGARRVGFWFLMNGTAQIVSGLLSYGVLRSNSALAPWRLFMIITGVITLVVACWFWLMFPDSPVTAKFLTKEEKIIAIERIRINNTGVENKTFKMDQFKECMMDWKTWGFFLYAAFDNVPNSLTNQNAIIIKSFGFTTLQTTLLGCIGGVVEIVTIYTGTLFVKKFPNARVIIATVYLIPNIVGAVLILALPQTNRTGLLAALYTTGVGTTGFVLSLAWCSAVTAGHTKKVTTNAVLLIGYCLGNLLAPQMWLAKYSPKNTIPWAMILMSYVICFFILPIMGYFLHKENKRRDALVASGEITEDYGFIDEVQADGTVVSKKVDVAFLDLTDRQNMSFRYVL